MKSYSTIFLFITILAYAASTQAQDKFQKHYPDVVIRGDEKPDQSNRQIIRTNGVTEFEKVYAGGLVFDIHNISSTATSYDLQSNASTQQVWVDLSNPDFIHAIFVNSQTLSPWSDRTCLYFGSTDAGVNWFELGAVPINNGTDGRSGFPVIYGLPTGEAVIADHNNSNGSIFTHTKIYSDDSPFGYNFSEHDPGNISDGPVWPRLTVTQDSIVFFASSGSPAPDDDIKINSLDLTSGQFSGWVGVNGGDAEGYDWSVSPGGKIGFAFKGRNTDEGDVWYMQSTDSGITWEPLIKVFDRDDSKDTTMGSLRGVQVNFYNEEPCVTYEVVQQIFSSGNFFPGLPSEIHFWSPNINGGLPKVIADSNNVPYFPYVGTNDVHVPLCRPVIGRTHLGALLLAFNATTGEVFPSPDTTSYMAGYFTYSSDGGDTWTNPEKFTPDTPLRDWRYPSIAEIVPAALVDQEYFKVQIVMQGDSIPGSTVNAAGMPVGVTAQYYHFSADVVIGNTGKQNGLIEDFILGQNYPNPFNPSTSIEYVVPGNEFISLKVYDVLGNEIATLVNEEKSSGSYQVKFDATGIPSGVYFYKLNAGEFSQTKKMILMK
jgi:hypothetical protein